VETKGVGEVGNLLVKNALEGVKEKEKSKWVAREPQQKGEGENENGLESRRGKI